MRLAALLLCALPQDTLLLEPPLAHARWVGAPEAVELGVPFELVLEIEHEAGTLPEVRAGELESDVAWAVLEASEPIVLPDLADPRRRVSEVRWSVVALEPGVRALPKVVVRQAGEGIAIENDAELEVTGVLAPGEDAPRPMPPDLGVGETPAARRGRILALVALVAVLAAGLVAWLLRRRGGQRVAAPARPRSPLERLAELENAPLDDPEAVRETHRELTRALRQHLDGDTPRDALTDEEWLAARALAPDGELARLFAECRPVEYGGERPTHWATRERVARARALAEQGAAS